MSNARRQLAGFPVSKGSKTTFSDAADVSFTQHPQSNSSAAETQFETAEDQDEESDGEAPEAVGIDEVKDLEMREARQEERLRQARKEAAGKRSRKIAAIKAKPSTVETTKRNLPNAEGTKRKRNAKPETDEDGEARRLRARMEKAMKESEEETSEESRGDETAAGLPEDEKDGGLDEGASSGEDGDAGDEASERLEDGPIDEETRRLRARMQAAMEAAERRAAATGPSPKLAPAVLKVSEENDDEAVYDLGPLPIIGKPLPASALRAAAAAGAERKKRDADAAKAQAEQGLPRKKRVRRRMKGRDGSRQVERKISDNKTLYLLAPSSHPSSASLPPVIEPLGRPQPARDPRKVFYNTAMKASGMIPGRGIVDGRKRNPGTSKR